MMYVGVFARNPCLISSSSKNSSIISTGIMGSGKSCRNNKIELACTQANQTVLVLDVHQTHKAEAIFPPLANEYENHTNRIPLLRDGLDLSLLSPTRNSNDMQEPFVHHVNSTLNALVATQNMGSKQIAALRTAIIYAIKNKDKYPSETVALATALLNRRDTNAHAVYQKLWAPLNSNILRPCNSKLKQGYINILDFTGIDDLTQAVLCELILSTLWRNVQFGTFQHDYGDILIVVDEFQNLSLKKTATLRLLLHEGRRWGVNLLLSTQTLEIFPNEIVSELTQTATRLYFRPSQFDFRKTVKEIMQLTGYDLSKELASLKTGECFGVGEFNCNGAEIKRPILLK